MGVMFACLSLLGRVADLTFNNACYKHDVIGQLVEKRVHCKVFLTAEQPVWIRELCWMYVLSLIILSKWYAAVKTWTVMVEKREKAEWYVRKSVKNYIVFDRKTNYGSHWVCHIIQVTKRSFKHAVFVDFEWLYAVVPSFFFFLRVRSQVRCSVHLVFSGRWVGTRQKEA